MRILNDIRHCLWTVGSAICWSLIYSVNSLALGCGDAAYVWVLASADTVFEAGGAPVQLTFMSDSGIGVTLTLQISGTAKNGVDYQTLPTQITLPAAAFGESSQASLTVTPIPDTKAEGTETLTVTITAVNQPCFLIGFPSSQTISIVEGDVPPPVALTVVPAGTGVGTVTSSPSGIDCGGDCSANFAVGANVLLTATPYPGSSFFEWGGACVGAGSCEVAMNAANNVTATFIYTGSVYSHDYVQKAFVAYYGRPGDPAGQAYWAGRMDAEEQSLKAIIGEFGYSDEFNRRYGGLSYHDLVTLIYQQALGRDPDQTGLDWYVGELVAGRRSLQTITLDVLNGATTAPDSTVVANKLTVAAYYTAKVAAGCPYGMEQDGVDAIAGVTALATSVTAAETGIDTRCAP